jgi:hypothetical protein
MSTRITALGKVIVTSHGTFQRLAAAAGTRVRSLRLQAIPTNGATDIVYVLKPASGDTGADTSALTNVLFCLVGPSVDVELRPEWADKNQEYIDLYDIAIDSSADNDAVLGYYEAL